MAVGAAVAALAVTGYPFTLSESGAWIAASRAKPTSITAEDECATLLALGNYYCPNQAATCTSNNGNVLSQVLSAPKTAGGLLTLTQAYGYGVVNRLSSASESGAGVAWSRSFNYTNDTTTGQLGNLTVTGSEVDSGLNCGIYSSATNRCTAANYGYDLAGNLTGYGNRTLAYDAENRQTSLEETAGTTFTYYYDGDGRRVKKVTNEGTTVYVYDAAGQLAAEYSDVTNPESGTQYLTADHLGSTRLVTDESGGVVSRYDYFPFGGETPAGYGDRASVTGYGASGDWINPKFTGQVRDYESGLNLDYFGARYYAGAMGRFSSADAPFADQHPEDPQSWNLYGYARNRPLLFIDPDGRAALTAIALGCAANPACRGAVGAVAGAFVSGAARVVQNVVQGQAFSLGVESAAIQGGIMGGAVAAVGPAGVKAAVAANAGLTSAGGAAFSMTAGTIARSATGQETSFVDLASDAFGGALAPAAAGFGASVATGMDDTARTSAEGAKAVAQGVSEFLPTLGASMAKEAAKRQAYGAAGAVVAGEFTGNAFPAGGSTVIGVVVEPAPPNRRTCISNELGQCQ